MAIFNLPLASGELNYIGLILHCTFVKKCCVDQWFYYCSNQICWVFFVCFWVFFQIPGAPDDEAVRIFLEFERVESAIKGRLLNCVI